MDLTALTLGEFLERLSAKEPVPGGGAVTAAVGALSAALSQMVLAYSKGRKDLAAHADAHEAAAEQLDRARWMLLELAAEDIQAYEALSAAMKLPKDDPARSATLSRRAAEAIRPPMAVIATCTELLRLFDSLAPITNRHLRSDLAIAAVLAEAAARASLWNVLVNLPLIDAAEAAEQRSRAEAMLRQAATRLGAVEKACLAT